MKNDNLICKVFSLKLRWGKFVVVSFNEKKLHLLIQLKMHINSEMLL